MKTASKEESIRITPPAFTVPGSLGRHTLQQGPQFPTRSLELAYHHQLVVVAVLHDCQFAFALGMDRPLRIVAVHDKNVMPQSVMQVAGQQYRECGFSDAAFLIAD